VTTYLPPLPVLPGEGDTYRYQPAGQNMLDLLAAEHSALSDLCARLRREPNHDDSSVLCAMMCRHLSAERQYLYPTALKALGAQAGPTVTAMLETDRQLLSDMDILLWSPPASELWDEALTRTESYLREHIAGCAAKLFVPLRSRLSEAELVRLGNRLEIAQEAAPSRPHPRWPRYAPWNKLTDALAGAVDKGRDLITGRKTFVPPHSDDRSLPVPGRVIPS
jgi:hypothetical protein